MPHKGFWDFELDGFIKYSVLEFKTPDLDAVSHFIGWVQQSGGHMIKFYTLSESNAFRVNATLTSIAHDRLMQEAKSWGAVSSLRHEVLFQRRPTQ